MKFDYLISSSLSVAMHGVLAAGLYGSMVTGPQIAFSPGNAGFTVHITTPAELGWTSAQSVPEQARTSDTPTRLLLPDPKPELSLAKAHPQKIIQKPRTEEAKPMRSASRIDDASRSMPQAAPASDLPLCNGAHCGSRASLGLSGDSGPAGAGVLHAPKPPYPWEARRAGFEGSLVVTVDIGKDGSVRNAELAQSSGRADCDKAALETIKGRWRFQPARFRGQPIDWREKVIVVYSLRQ